MGSDQAERSPTPTEAELRRPRPNHEGRGRCKHGISRPRGPRPKQTWNGAAQRAGAEIDLGYTQLGNWLVGGEPWLMEPAHLETVGMQMLFRVRGRCDGSEEPRAYSSVY